MSNDIIFEPFRLDRPNQCLWRGTERLHLRTKRFAVLQYLLEHHDQLVSKQELHDVVWADVQVSGDVVKGYVLEIRKALEDNQKTPRFIETDQRRGYRFSG